MCPRINLFRLAYTYPHKRIKNGLYVDYARFGVIRYSRTANISIRLFIPKLLKRNNRVSIEACLAKSRSVELDISDLPQIKISVGQYSAGKMVESNFALSLHSVYKLAVGANLRLVLAWVPRPLPLNVALARQFANFATRSPPYKSRGRRHIISAPILRQCPTSNDGL